jgi:hypothetical protein
VYIGHSPFLVLGIGLACPVTSGASHAYPATSSTSAGTTRIAMRFMRFTPGRNWIKMNDRTVHGSIEK